MIRLLVALALLPACMRGCPANRATPCDETEDCDDGLRCHRGYCMSPEIIAHDDSCRASPACAEYGACTIVNKRSFLGLGSGLECAATLEADCRAATRCKTHGLCTRIDAYDVGCVVPDRETCRTTERCKTHAECEFEKHECVRDWSACKPLERPVRPHLAWARDDEIIDGAWFGTATANLGDAWAPGTVDNAVLACRITGRRKTPSIVRIADRCVAGPAIDREGQASFVLPRTRLAPGDTIAVAIQDAPIGHADKSSFVQLRYDGTSPMRAGKDGESLECHVVAPDVAQRMAREQLALVDKALAAAAREQPDLYRQRPMAVSIETARDRAWRAARWIGWDDPELARRITRIDAETARWQARLDKAIAALEKAKPRKRYPNELPRRVDVAIRSHTLVCGEALRDRRAGKPTAPEHCAVELEIENTGERRMMLETGSHRVAFELGELRWLRRAHDDVPAEIMDALVIDLTPAERAATKSSAKQLELAPGQRAHVLVAGAREDLALATADHATLLAGRITFGDPFVLRMP